jgi:hypothetical protein
MWFTKMLKMPTKKSTHVTLKALRYIYSTLCLWHLDYLIVLLHFNKKPYVFKFQRFQALISKSFLKSEKTVFQVVLFNNVIYKEVKTLLFQQKFINNLIISVIQLRYILTKRSRFLMAGIIQNIWYQKVF